MERNMFLTLSDSKKLHNYALQILEEIGVSLDHPEAEKILLEAGAKKYNDRIYFPRQLVEETLNQAVESFDIYTSNGEAAMQLDSKGETYFGSGADALYQIDMETNKRRFSTLEDVEANIRLLDKLNMFDFIMSTALPQPDDIDQTELYSKIFEIMVANSSKPIITTLTTLNDLKKIHAQAVEVAGGAEEFSKKPFYLVYLEPISPLIMDRDSTERILFCADNNIPFLYAGAAICGSSAPVTPEGGLVQGIAEFLCGYVLTKLRNKKAKIVFGANNSAIDPKTILTRYGCPEWIKTSAVYADMGRYYKMPSWGTGGCSDAKEIGFLSAWEVQQGIGKALESGVSLVHDVGYFDYGQTYDPRMLLLANEIIRREKFLRKPLDLSESSINEAIDVIKDVTNGDEIFPAHMHTAMNLRKALYIPKKYAGNSENYFQLLKEEVEKLRK